MNKSWRSILSCIISATLLSLSFPSANIWILAWFAFIPLFIAIRGQRPMTAFLLGCLNGLVFFYCTIYWLSYVTVWGMLILVLYLALYSGIFAVFANKIFSKELPVLAEALFISCFWVVLEFIRARAFTGFGWALLGYSQWLKLPIIQIADVTGAFGVSFVIMAVNVLLFSLLRGNKKSRLSTLGSILIILSAVYLYGFFRISNVAPKKEQIRISVVQGNIPQEEKWDLQQRWRILDKYVRLSETAGLDKPDLIIWPETAVPGDFNEEPRMLYRIKSLARRLNVDFIVGAPAVISNEEYHNSAFLILKDGTLKQRYDKIRLVPFGEYIPFENYLGFIRNIAPVPIGYFTKGRENLVFQNKSSVLICFEDIFPDLVRGFVKKDAGFLINITNDAWFKDSSAPYQHAQASVFRAVENKRPVIRCANTGLSVFIDAFGKQIGSVCNPEGREIFIEGHCTRNITTLDIKTFYTKYGDFFVMLCAIGWFLSLVILKRRAK